MGENKFKCRPLSHIHVKQKHCRFSFHRFLHLLSFIRLPLSLFLMFTFSVHFLLLFCASMVTIFLQVYFFSCSSVPSSLVFIVFYTVQESLYSKINDDQSEDPSRNILLITHALCQCMCCILRYFSFTFSLFVYKTHKAPALNIALFSPTSVFHFFHPRTFLLVNYFFHSFVIEKCFSLICHSHVRVSKIEL